MKKAAIIFLFLMVAINAIFSGVEAAGNNPYIVRGEDATVEEYPFMARVLVNGSFRCTSSIISSQSILTVSFDFFSFACNELIHSYIYMNVNEMINPI